MSDHHKNEQKNVEANKNEEEQQQQQEQGLENLLKNLHKQIKTSDWLSVNTVEKIEKENPELIKAWNEEINKK